MGFESSAVVDGIHHVALR